MTIEVRPLTMLKQDKELIPSHLRRELSSIITGNELPTVFYSSDGEDASLALLRYRKVSHNSEIELRTSLDLNPLLDGCLLACLYQSIIEGRKRVTLSIPKNEDTEELLMSLVEFGFTREGVAKYYGPNLEDVHFLSWVFFLDGVPQMNENYRLVLGENEKSIKYRDKNLSDYAQDTSITKAGETFGEILQKNIDYVRDLDSVEIIPNWSRKGLVSSQ